MERIYYNSKKQTKIGMSIYSDHSLLMSEIVILLPFT